MLIGTLAYKKCCLFNYPNFTASTRSCGVDKRQTISKCKICCASPGGSMVLQEQGLGWTLARNAVPLGNNALKMCTYSAYTQSVLGIDFSSHSLSTDPHHADPHNKPIFKSLTD